MLSTSGVIWLGSFFIQNYMFVRFRETHLVGLDFFSNAILCSSEGFYSLWMI